MYVGIVAETSRYTSIESSVASEHVASLKSEPGTMSPSTVTMTVPPESSSNSVQVSPAMPTETATIGTRVGAGVGSGVGAAVVGVGVGARVAGDSSSDGSSDGTGAGGVLGSAVGAAVGADVGDEVRRLSHKQHISFEVKSSSSYTPHQLSSKSSQCHAPCQLSYAASPSVSTHSGVGGALGAAVGNGVDEPPPQMQHISSEVKSSSS